MFLASASEGIIMRTMCLGLTPAVLSPPRPTSERKRRGQPRRHILKHEGLDLAEVKVKSLDGLVDLHGNPCSSEVHVFLPTSDSSEWILVPRLLIGPLSTYPPQPFEGDRMSALSCRFPRSYQVRREATLMLLNDVFERFVQDSPVSVMVRGLLEQIRRGSWTNCSRTPRNAPVHAHAPLLLGR